MPYIDDWDEDIEDRRTVAEIISDGYFGCPNCGDSFERLVRPDGTVEACDDCGDDGFNLFVAAEKQVP